jgi:UDP-2,3-diacylglucosamine hydrolase
VAQALRAQSQQTQAQKQRDGAPFADVDGPAAARWLQSAQAQVLVHGHTHQPATHALPGGLSRQVLSDWDGQAQPPRAQVLRLAGGRWQRIDL